MSAVIRFHPLAGLFPLMEGREFDELVADVKANGLHEPIWLHEGQILDGRNRWLACETASVQPIFRAYEGDDPVAFVLSLNLHRRHLSESQRSMVAAKLANLRDGQRADLVEGLPIGRASEMLNVGERTVARAREVIDHGAPELVRAVEAGAVSVSAAADVAVLPEDEQKEIVARGEREILEAAARIRRARTAEVVARNTAKKRAAASLALPVGTYRTVVIDPPWPMALISRDVDPNAVAMHYPVMSVEEIKAFELPLAEDQATVYLWTTQRFLPVAFDVMRAWGLDYHFTMTWHKSGGPQPFNLPQFNSEFIVVATRGGVLFLDTKEFFTSFQAPRREHSRKPDEFYELVRRVSPGPRIEIFAREERVGFDVWGDETGKFAA